MKLYFRIAVNEHDMQPPRATQRRRIRNEWREDQISQGVDYARNKKYKLDRDSQ